MQAVSRYRGFIVKIGARGHCGEAGLGRCVLELGCRKKRLGEYSVVSTFHQRFSTSLSLTFLATIRISLPAAPADLFPPGLLPLPTFCFLITSSVPALPLVLPLSWVLP